VKTKPVCRSMILNLGLLLAVGAGLIFAWTPAPAFARSLERGAPAAQATDFASLLNAAGTVIEATSAVTTTLVSSTNPAAIGQTVMFTATVHTAPGSPAPTGTVQFKVDGANLGAAVALSGRKASVSTSWPTNNTHTLTAVYSGDVVYVPNTSVPMLECIGVSGCDSGEGWSNQENSFILSNEAPGYLIHKLVAAGYGSSSVYTATLYLKTLPGANAILTDAFIQALANAPATSEIFNTYLNQVDLDGAVAINTDGTAFFMDVYGQDNDHRPNTTTLHASNGTLGFTNFAYSNNPQVPLQHWSRIYTYGGGLYSIVTTYNAFAVAWMPGTYSIYLPLVRR
jgi:hypothetical protein